jgi:hypothetical protein
MMGRAKAFLWVVAALAAAGIAAPGAAWARPDKPKPGELWKYAEPSKLEHHDTAAGAFRLHYVRQGADAVPEGDVDADGTPDYVQQLGQTYEEALAFYKKLGFDPPPADQGAGGDERFDVYLLDFAGKGDGNFVSESCKAEVCAGYMVQENDFAGYGYPSVAYANRILSSHELFHAVQAGYDAKQSSIISEGTAVWATEQFDASLHDFEDFLPGYLLHPDRSLDKPMIGPVDSFSYGAAIFFQFLSERYGTDAVLHLWQDCRNGARGVANPDWFSALAALVIREFGSDFAEELSAFAQWNLRTGSYADPDNSYKQGAKYSKVATIPVTLPYRDDDLRVFYASSQYLRFAPNGRKEIAVALQPKTDPASLRLGLVARKGKVFGDWLWLGAPTQQPLWTLDTAGMDEAFVLLVNTAQGGESVRGSLCIGSPAEAAACLPPAPAEDAGSTDAGGDDADTAVGSADTSAPAKPAASAASADSGCTAGPSAGGSGAAVWAFLLAVWAVRRRWPAAGSAA